jgi:hypothetical protein
LYDFLYRDSSRITSYYAQIFGGHLKSVQDTDSEKDSRDKVGRLNLQLANADLRSGRENLQSQTRVIDPHDLIATDVLVRLSTENRFHDNVEKAPHGSLIIASGTVLFIDRSMMEIAKAVFDGQASEAIRAARSAPQKAAARAQKQLLPILNSIEMPSGFLLHTDRDLDIVGTLKESGMEEPISTYYFKHGAAGLAEVYLAGIKEEPSFSVLLPAEKMIGVGQTAAAALKELMFPERVITVTPIAMFREI